MPDMMSLLLLTVWLQASPNDPGQGAVRGVAGNDASYCPQARSHVPPEVLQVN